MISRRQALVGGVVGTVMAVGRPVQSQSSNKLTIFSHPIHRTVATGQQGGDITAAWRTRTNVTVDWATFDVEPLQERLFREASLREGAADIGFLLDSQITPRVSNLFEPLDEFLQREPIEDIGDMFTPLLDAMRVGGRLYALPYRHTSDGFHYNAEILAERGITAPPRTIEEFAEVAKRCTFTRPDGSPVVGLVLPGGLAAYTVCNVYRAWDGEIITRDMRVTANEPPVVKAITMLRDLFVAGALPRNFTSISIEETNVWMQQGRSAMILTGMARNAIFNDPAKSKFPGKIMTTTIPVSHELLGKFEVAPAKVNIWSMAIPKNSRNKALAWSLMREMVSKEAAVATALNGNGPVRASAYSDARIRSRMPFADDERRVLQVARVPLPAFDNATRAGDIFKEEAENAVLGRKSPQQAMDDVAARVKPLLG